MAGAGGRGLTGRAWRAAVVLGLLLVAAALAYPLLYPLVLGHGCPCRDRTGRLVVVLATPRDLWIAVDAARYVASGALGFVYESNRFLTALPLYPILLAPLVGVGQALGLSEPPAPTATMYLLLAPFTVGIAIPLLHQARGLLRDAGVVGRCCRRRCGRRCWSAARCWSSPGTARTRSRCWPCSPPSGPPPGSAG